MRFYLRTRSLRSPGCLLLNLGEGPWAAAKLGLRAGIAPLQVSSGQNQHHPLNRFGNRKLNCAIHRIAITQGNDLGKAYIKRKRNKARRSAKHSDA